LGISKIRIKDEPVLGISPYKTRIKELASSGYFQKGKLESFFPELPLVRMLEN